MGFMSFNTKDEKGKAEESQSHEHVQLACKPVSHSGVTRPQHTNQMLPTKTLQKCQQNTSTSQDFKETVIAYTISALQNVLCDKCEWNLLLF